MVSVCLYLQVHQPPRLRRYSVFDNSPHYFDEERNLKILNRVAGKCYLPATQLLLDLVRRHEGRFRLAFSLTGVVLESLQHHVPQVIHLLQELAATGCVEFLAETYHHSLAFLYSREEFAAQVELHERLIRQLFGQTPRVFRNTELVYSNELASYVHSWGKYQGMLAEGADAILAGRSPNVLYHPPANPQMKLLLKNYRLSDDIAFRFSNQGWSEWPLTAEKFADWIHRINEASPAGAVGKGRSTGAKKSERKKEPTAAEMTREATRPGQVCNLFMDFETFGEHQWADTGIFKFLEALPGEILQRGDEFQTPGQCVEHFPADEEFDAPVMISWADTERDLSAWLGNAMQSNALHELYRLEAAVKKSGDPALLSDWRLLTTSDHFYYMCTKYFADGDVHKYFNPYESPYDAYINFMNVMDNLRSRAEEVVG